MRDTIVAVRRRQFSHHAYFRARAEENHHAPAITREHARLVAEHEQATRRRWWQRRRPESPKPAWEVAAQKVIERHLPPLRRVFEEVCARSPSSRRAGPRSAWRTPRSECRCRPSPVPAERERPALWAGPASPSVRPPGRPARGRLRRYASRSSSRSGSASSSSMRKRGRWNSGADGTSWSGRRWRPRTRWSGRFGSCPAPSSGSCRVASRRVVSTGEARAGKSCGEGYRQQGGTRMTTRERVSNASKATLKRVGEAAAVAVILAIGAAVAERGECRLRSSACSKWKPGHSSSSWGGRRRPG